MNYQKNIDSFIPKADGEHDNNIDRYIEKTTQEYSKEIMNTYNQIDYLLSSYNNSSFETIQKIIFYRFGEESNIYIFRHPDKDVFKIQKQDIIVKKHLNVFQKLLLMQPKNKKMIGEILIVKHKSGSYDIDMNIGNVQQKNTFSLSNLEEKQFINTLDACKMFLSKGIFPSKNIGNFQNIQKCA